MRRIGLERLVRTVAASCSAAGIASCVLFPAPDDRWTTGDADAAIDRDGPSSGFCAANVDLTFCADFDGPDFAAGWTSSLAKGGTLTADSTQFRSPPTAAHLEADRAGSGPSPSVVFFRDLPSAGATAHLELDLFVVRVDGDAVQIFQVARGPDLAVSLSFGAAGANLTEEVALADGGAYSRAHSFTARLSPGAWHHLVFDVVFVGAKTMSLRVDDAAALGTTPLAFAGDAVGAGRLRLGIGYATAGSYDFLIDNVALRM